MMWQHHTLRFEGDKKNQSAELFQRKKLTLFA